MHTLSPQFWLRCLFTRVHGRNPLGCRVEQLEEFDFEVQNYIHRGSKGRSTQGCCTNKQIDGIHRGRTAARRSAIRVQLACPLNSGKIFNRTTPCQRGGQRIPSRGRRQGMIWPQIWENGLPTGHVIGQCNIGRATTALDRCIVVQVCELCPVAETSHPIVPVDRCQLRKTWYCGGPNSWVYIINVTWNKVLVKVDVCSI